MGIDTDMYLSQQNLLNFGGRLEIAKTWNLRKIPKVQRIEGKIQAKIGDGLNELGRKMQKIAGDHITKATKIKQQVDNAEVAASNAIVNKCNSHVTKAKVWEWVGSTLKAKGKKVWTGGSAKFNDALKISD